MAQRLSELCRDLLCQTDYSFLNPEKLLLFPLPSIAEKILVSSPRKLPFAMADQLDLVCAHSRFRGEVQTNTFFQHSIDDTGSSNYRNEEEGVEARALSGVTNRTQRAKLNLFLQDLGH